GMAPHQRPELPDLLEPRAERGDLLGEPPRGQRALGEQQRLVEVEGLGQVVVGAVLHGGDRGLHGAVRGHDHHLRVGPLVPHLLEERQAVDAGHADVEQDQVEGPRRHLPERRGAVLDRGDLIARATEALLQDPAQAVLVVGDEDLAGRAGGAQGARAHRRAMGRKQDMVVPRPGSLTTWMAPRCSSMMRWQRASPRPRPLSLVVKNGVKSRARADSGMPRPESITWISAMLRWPWPRSTLANSGSMLSRVTRVSRPPRSMASIALRTRLWKTCRMRSSSARIGGRLGS